MAPQAAEAQEKSLKGLKDVKNIIAVSSCKGGVGKSTVAVNLTFSLQNLGCSVGLFDADVYGPSLPTMINPEKPTVYQSEVDPQGIMPVEFNGIPTMSYGFAASGRAGIMRGPMVSNLIT